MVIKDFQLISETYGDKEPAGVIAPLVKEVVDRKPVEVQHD